MWIVTYEGSISGGYSVLVKTRSQKSPMRAALRFPRVSMYRGSPVDLGSFGRRQVDNARHSPAEGQPLSSGFIVCADRQSEVIRAA